MLALPDPNITNSLTADVVWGSIANGRGCMIDCVGNRSREARFQITSATPRLSNSTPQAQDSLLGFASAMLHGWLLQAPIGIEASSFLSMTVLARCCLETYNPIPGFAMMQSPYLLATPNIAPNTPISWMIKTTTVKGVSMNSNGQKWALGHIGDAWLAGGWYLQFWGAGGNAPQVGSTPTSNSVVTITGTPKKGCVYICNSNFPEWETNRGIHMIPKYFATFWSPISGTITLVGFSSYEDAVNQASGNTGMVPPNTELCVKYAYEPKWDDFHLMNAGNAIELQFFEVFAVNSPVLSGNIYSTTNEITGSASGPNVTPSAASAIYTMAPSRMAYPQLAPLAPATAQYSQTLPLQGGSTQYWSVPTSTTTSAAPCLPNSYANSLTSSQEWEQDTEEEQDETDQPLSQETFEQTLQNERRWAQLSNLELNQRIEVLRQQMEELEVEHQTRLQQCTDILTRHYQQGEQAVGSAGQPSETSSVLTTTTGGLPRWQSLLQRALAVASQHTPQPPTSHLGV